MRGRSEDPFGKLLSDLFPRPKEATLTQDVIEAVQLYNKREHQTLIQEWLAKDKHAVDGNGQTLLHHAVFAGRLQLVEFFLKKGLNKDSEDNKGFTPLIYAVAYAKEVPLAQREKVLNCIEKLLIANAKVVSSGDFPQVAVNNAAAKGDLEVLQLLERHGAAINEDCMGTPLWWADNCGKTEVAEYLRSKDCTSTLGGL